MSYKHVLCLYMIKEHELLIQEKQMLLRSVLCTIYMMAYYSNYLIYENRSTSSPCRTNLLLFVPQVFDTSQARKDSYSLATWKHVFKTIISSQIDIQNKSESKNHCFWYSRNISVSGESNKTHTVHWIFPKQYYYNPHNLNLSH